ncbi:MAG: endonuclease/exonuclease/phosphatase family protein [Methylotetracoccus sp.]
MVLLVLLGLSLSACVNLHVGSPAPCSIRVDPPEPLPLAAHPSRVRLLSWNLHGVPAAGPMQSRIARVAAVLRRLQPDLVLLQELWFDGDRGALAAALADLYIGVEDDPAVRSWLWPLLRLRNGGLAAFVRRGSIWRVDEHASRFVRFAASAPVWRLTEGDGIAGKGYQTIVIANDLRRVTVINAHLQASYPRRGHPYDEVQRAQLHELLTAAEHTADDVIIAGDLNLDAERLRHLAPPGWSTRWSDVTEEFERGCRCGTHVSRSGRSGEWIDRVLVRTAGARRIAPLSLRLIRNSATDCPYSDHHGVEVLVELPTARPKVPSGTR